MKFLYRLLLLLADNLLSDFSGGMKRRLTTSGLSSLRVGHCLLSDLAGDMKRCLTATGLSSLRVGHCLLSDLAGDMKRYV